MDARPASAARVPSSRTAAASSARSRSNDEIGMRYRYHRWHERLLLSPVAVGKTRGEPAGSLVWVGSENGHLVRHTLAVHREGVVHGRSEVHLRKLAARFLERLLPTASPNRSRPFPPPSRCRYPWRLSHKQTAVSAAHKRASNRSWPTSCARGSSGGLGPASVRHCSTGGTTPTRPADATELWATTTFVDGVDAAIAAAREIAAGKNVTIGSPQHHSAGARARIGRRGVRQRDSMNLQPGTVPKDVKR